MPKLLFARKLSDRERSILLDTLKSKYKHLKERARMILLSAEHRYRITEISRIVEIHPVNLRKWIRRFNEKGLESVLDAPKVGKKKEFDENFKEELVEIVKESPRKFGLFFSNWTLKNLKEYLEEKKIVYKVSEETIRKILREANLNLKELRKKIKLEPEF